jgi:hypothetical protein
MMTMMKIDPMIELMKLTSSQMSPHRDHRRAVSRLQWQCRRIENQIFCVEKMAIRTNQMSFAVAQ